VTINRREAIDPGLEGLPTDEALREARTPKGEPDEGYTGFFGTAKVPQESEEPVK